MRNLHNILSDKYVIRVLHLVREWEKIQIKECNYRNQCRFTLRCIHKGIIPVSVRLQTTIESEKAKKIIRKAERDLLQARIKFINNILDNNSKQLEKCKSQLASLVTTTIMEECEGFINKVREFRHSKIRDRQINTFNRLVAKQEGKLANPANIPYSQLGRSPGANFPLPTTPLTLPAKRGISQQSGLFSPRNSSTPQWEDTVGSAQDVRAWPGDMAGSTQDATVLRGSLIPLPGDMAGSAWDQVPVPGVALPDAHPIPAENGNPPSQPGTSSDTPLQGDDKLDDPSNRWVKYLS